MSEACKVIAAVTAEGFVAFGKSEATAVYVCTASGIYTAPAAPLKSYEHYTHCSRMVFLHIS